MNNKERIKELLEKYQAGTITDEEMVLMSNLVDIETFNQFHDDVDLSLIEGEEYD